MGARTGTAAVTFPSVALSRLALCEGNAKKPVYMMHKWWARRLGVVFRMLLIRHAAGENVAENVLWKRFYSGHALPPGFRVLDPFLGGGTTLVEAAKQGASCIGVDIDPVACFVTQLELRPPDPEAIDERFQEIEEELGKDLLGLYRSRVDGIGDVDVVYYFWVDRVTCPECGAEGDAHPTFQVAFDAALRTQTVVCPSCGDLTELPLGRKNLDCHCGTRTHLADVPVKYGKFTCAGCDGRRPLHELWSSGAVTPRLFAQEFVDPNASTRADRLFASTGPLDVKRYKRATRAYAKEKGRLPIPNDRIPAEGRSDRRPLLYGYTHYREMFNDRQLLCLGRIASAIRRTEDPGVRQALTMAFSHSLATNNMFCSYAFGYRRLCPIFSVHAFRKVPRPVEGNVWGLHTGRGSFRNAVRALIAGSDYMRAPYEYRYDRGARPERVSVTREPPSAGRAPKRSVTIYNRSSERLTPIETGSIDLVLTDPPYYDNLSYSELSDFYHVWLRKVLGEEYVGAAQEHTPMTTAIYGGKRKGGDEDPVDQFTRRLSDVFAECHRVTKRGGGLIFTFHHRDPIAWNALGRAVLGAGFLVHEVCPVRSEGRSGLHTYDGTIKWDAVFVCSKGAVSRRVAPTPAALRAASLAADEEAKKWATHLRRSRLAFSVADQNSFAMASSLKVFSDRRFDLSYLRKALELVVPSSAKRPAAVRALEEESDGS